MKRDLLTALWRANEAPRLGGCEWELLLAQARAARLAARLAHLFTQRGWMPSVPEAPRQHLESARRIAERLHQQVRFEVDQLQAALKAVPTPVVLLKGAAYVMAGLPPARGRLFSDVDILVSSEQLRRVESALLAAGWIPEKLSPYDDRYYREWMHELPPLQHVVRQTVLDVHHTVTPPTSRFAVDGAPLLARRQALAGVPGFGVLAPTDMVLHSAVHLLQEGDFSGGLRDLLDLNDLLLHFGSTPAFWPELASRARELGLQAPVCHALHQLERLFGTRPPAEAAPALRAMAPVKPLRLVMSGLLAVALRPDHPSCNLAQTAMARWVLYVRSHWLRMPWYQIVPHLLRKLWTRTLDRYRRPRTPKAAPHP